jgi:hypothetical protein
MNTLITITIILFISSVALITYFMLENRKAVSRYLNGRKRLHESFNLEKYSKAS